MKCLFCDKESIHEKRVPNVGEMCGLCDEHYMSKSSGEILERWRTKDEPEKEAITAYCCKCKKIKEMLNPNKSSLKNGTFGWKGGCSVCGTNMFRMIGRE